MNTTKYIVGLVLMLINGICHAQTTNDYSDYILAQTFKSFNSVDFEMANYMQPFVLKRFTEHLLDTSSYHNPFDSLSKHLNINYSLDSVLKTYTWSNRSGGCCHTSTNFVQYRTEAGNIKNNRLLSNDIVGGGYFVTHIDQLELNNKPVYLIRTWESCCGGKYSRSAFIYQLSKDSLIQCDSVFANSQELHIGANRSQKVNVTFDAEKKTLMYREYLFDEDTGFYQGSFQLAQWQWTNNRFIRVK